MDGVGPGSRHHRRRRLRAIGGEALLPALLLLLAGCGPAVFPSPTPFPGPPPVPTPRPGVLYVDAAWDLGPISPLVYGTNYGPWVTVPYDLLPQAEAAGLTYLRFPGGAWGDQNDLTDRQIQEYLDLARRMGCTPSISVRLPGNTPEKAAALVARGNKNPGDPVRYWSIGNEPDLLDGYDTERYNREWRAFAEAMRAVDAEILLIGPDISQYTGNPAVDPHDAAGRDWLEEFLKANGDLVDIISIHRYPFPRGLASSPTTIADLQANSREWDEIIPHLRATIRRVTGRDLPVAVTEVNSHWSKAVGGEATPDSFYNAIWWGDVLGRLIRQRVEIVAHFVLQTSTGAGGWGLLGRFEVRPTYYVYQMYRHFGQELLYASSDDPDLSIYAARRSDGALTVMVINLGAEEKKKPLLLENYGPSAPAEVWLFDAPHPAQLLGRQEVLSGQDAVWPAQSMSLLVLPPR